MLAPGTGLKNWSAYQVVGVGFQAENEEARQAGELLPRKKREASHGALRMTMGIQDAKDIG
jgi:hypothetical protein